MFLWQSFALEVGNGMAFGLGRVVPSIETATSPRIWTSKP
jgi:hypothetical protein